MYYCYFDMNHTHIDQYPTHLEDQTAIYIDSHSANRFMVFVACYYLRQYIKLPWNVLKDVKGAYLEL